MGSRGVGRVEGTWNLLTCEFSRDCAWWHNFTFKIIKPLACLVLTNSRGTWNRNEVNVTGSCEEVQAADLQSVFVLCRILGITKLTCKIWTALARTRINVLRCVAIVNKFLLSSSSLLQISGTEASASAQFKDVELRTASAEANCYKSKIIIEEF